MKQILGVHYKLKKHPVARWRTSPVNLWTVGGNQNTWGAPTQALAEYARSTQLMDLNPGPSCCDVTVVTTAPPYRPG